MVAAISLLQPVMHPAELMPGGSLHLRLVELPKQSLRCLVVRQRVVELALDHGQRTEPREVDALAPEVLQFHRDLERRLVCLPRVAESTAGANRPRITARPSLGTVPSLASVRSNTSVAWPTSPWSSSC